MIASLLGEPYHLSLDTIAGLTDRQLVNLYCHPRKKDGTLEDGISIESRQMTPEEEEAIAMSMAQSLGVALDKMQRLKEALHGQQRRNDNVD